MKVLAFDRLPESSSEFPLSVDLMPDCSIIKDRKPFFVPPFSEHWSYYAAPAFKVCRLGKFVGAKFATRYIDAMTLAIITRPCDVLEVYSGLQYGLYNSYEGALILGDWIPVDEAHESAQVTVGGVRVDCKPLLDEWKQIPSLVENISSVCTMKIGDIIVPSRVEIARDLKPDSVIEGSIDGTEVLSLRIK